MSRIFMYLSSVAALALFSSALFAESASLVQVRLVDPLDEPEYYCLDISGWGDHLKLDDPIQAHTCKGADGADQMFVIRESRIQVLETDRCLEVAGSGKPLPGAAVIARACSDSPMQSLRVSATGRIEVSGTDLCLAAGPDSAAASGPSHMWRVLSVQGCDAVKSVFNTWQVGI